MKKLGFWITGVGFTLLLIVGSANPDNGLIPWIILAGVALAMMATGNWLYNRAGGM